MDHARQDCAAVLPFAAYLWRLPELETLLGMPLVASPLTMHRMRVVACAGWGLRPSARYAAWRARRQGLPCLRLEDGFIRSVALGNTDPPLSIVVDDLGIFYDATRPSRLEAMIPEKLLPAEAERARLLAATWRSERVSKYNHLPEFERELPERYVLAIDQTLGDLSIRYGHASCGSFRRMLDAALSENPDATVLLKIHPDVFAGRKRAHFDPATLAGIPRLRVLAEDVHPATLIERAAAVYVVTSTMGFEALMWNRRVRVFGMPFYAGWGLTDDELPAPDRRGSAALEQLVHAALVRYARYLDPDTGARCEPERLIEWMGARRRARHKR